VLVLLAMGALLFALGAMIFRKRLPKENHLCRTSF